MKTADQLIDYVAVTESGGSYTAFNPDDNGRGVSFGLIQFNQAVGTLPELIRGMEKADPDAYKGIFGRWVHVIDTKRGVRGTNWNDPDLKSRLRQSGNLSAFQAVQRQLAQAGYLEPAWIRCKAWRLNSERAAAMAFDTAVQHGLGDLSTFLEQAFEHVPEPSDDKRALDLHYLAWLAHGADAGLGGPANGRRHKILRDPKLSDEPWNFQLPLRALPRLKRGSQGPSVVELQQRLHQLGHFKGGAWLFSETFGQKTEAAVRAFQRTHDLAADGVVWTRTWRALDEALEAQRKEGGSKP